MIPRRKVCSRLSRLVRRVDGQKPRFFVRPGEAFGNAPVGDTNLLENIILASALWKAALLCFVDASIAVELACVCYSSHTPLSGLPTLSTICGVQREPTRKRAHHNHSKDRCCQPSLQLSRRHLEGIYREGRPKSNPAGNNVSGEHCDVGRRLRANCSYRR